MRRGNFGGLRLVKFQERVFEPYLPRSLVGGLASLAEGVGHVLVGFAPSEFLVPGRIIVRAWGRGKNVKTLIMGLVEDDAVQ